MESTARGSGFLLFLAAVLAVYLFSRSSFFQIDQVSITGNRQVEAGEIAALAGSVVHQNIWQVSPEDLEERILHHPLIAAVQVERRLPGTLAVIVVERQEAAVVATAEDYLAVDQTGVVLRSYPALSGITVPLITGLRLQGEPQVGRVLPSTQLPQVLPILEALQVRAGEIVSELAILPGGIDLYTIEGVRVKLGDAGNLGAKLDLLEDIYRQQQQTGDLWRLEYIDLQYVNAPVFKYRSAVQGEVGD